MGVTVKVQSSTGFIYEKNNFASYVDTEASGREYHKMMEFIKRCKLSYAMLAKPTIYHEVVEEIWTTAVFNSTDETITFTLKGTKHVINSDVIESCLRIPANNSEQGPTNDDLVTMLKSLNYALDTSNISDIGRRGLRKEWSYFCDAFVKAFSGKISNFDALTPALLRMLYMLLNDKYYNFSTSVLYEIGAKLGDLKKRLEKKSIYFARFLMLLANHVHEGEIPIANEGSKMSCWVQDKRVLKDIDRMNHNASVPLVYPAIFEVTLSNSQSSSQSISLPSSTAMEAAVNVPQPPTQAVKSKSSKSKSKKPTSSVSQKTLVVKTTKPIEGSAQVVVSGEGRDEHQRNPKNKVGELSVSQPSHTTVSQKAVAVEKVISTSLAASSQQDAVIEKSSHPGTQNKRGRDTTLPYTFAETYKRKKVRTPTKGAQGSHTAQTSVLGSVIEPSQIQLDVAPTNVESQPQSSSLNTQTSSPKSPSTSIDVEMIHTSLIHSPTLFLEKSNSEPVDHHPTDELLDQQSTFLQESVPEFVSPNAQSLYTDSVITSIPSPPFSSSTGILHPLPGFSSSTGMPNSSCPLTLSTIASTGVSHPLEGNQSTPIETSSMLATLTEPSTTSVEIALVAETLIGLREGCETTVSERQPCELAKGENECERLTISSSQAKGETESTTLVGEGEGVTGVSQGEPLMQQKRDNERNAGTGEIRVEENLEVNEATKEAEYQKAYQAEIAKISLDAETFTHPNAALQILASQGNQEAETSLRLVHTTESLQRAKEAISNLPQHAGADVEFENEDSVSETEAEDETLPRWLMDKDFLQQAASVEIAKLFKKAVDAKATTSLSVQDVQDQYIGTLKLHKSLINQMRRDKEEILHSVDSTEKRLLKDLGDRLPMSTLSQLLKAHRDTTALDRLTKRVDQLETQMNRMIVNQGAILAGQRHHDELLEKFLKQGVMPPADNKKGEKVLQDVRTSILQNETSQVPTSEGEQVSTSQGEPTSIVGDSIAQRLATTSLSLPPIPPTNYTIRQVLISDLVFSERPFRGEPSYVSEFKPIIKLPSSPEKKHGKLAMNGDYPSPRPDNLKLLSAGICKQKNSPNHKERFALIHRNGIPIQVPIAHPRFVEAKKEELASELSRGIVVDQPSSTLLDSDEALRLASELERELQEEGYGVLGESAQDQSEVIKKKTKSVGKKKKARANRPLSFETEEEREQPSMQPEPVKSPPKENLNQEQAVDPRVKQEIEELDWDKMVFPKFIVPQDIVSKKRTRKPPARPIKLSEVPQIAKVPSKKDTEIYIATIEEYSDTNYFLNELIDVKGIAASARQPERLVFVYKGGNEITWPLKKVLLESYSTLTKVWSRMKRLGGYTPDAKIKILNKINEIRKGWSSKEGLPRKLNLPFTGKKVHLEPFWMLEFRDDYGCRRFFRLEDQLEKASNDYLRFLLTKLNPEDQEEGIFYRTLERQIETNNEKSLGVRRAKRQKDSKE